MVGSCVGNLIHIYQQELDRVYDSNTQFEIAQESLQSGSFN